MTFVDIGANIGSYSTFVSSRANHNLTLLSFEPHPRTYQKLLYNLRLNGVPTDHIMNCALGDKEGSAELWSDAGSNAGATSLLSDGGVVKNEVSVFPLLDMCRQEGVDSIDLLKIDVEGFEDRVLSSFFATSPSSLLPSVMIIETAHDHLWQIDLHNLFLDSGYRLISKNVLNAVYEK